MKISGNAQLLLCFLAGLGIAIIAISPIAVTSAVATPAGFLPWFRAMGAIGLGLFVWNSLVVHGLGVDILAFFTLFAMYRGPVSPTVRSAGFFVAGSLTAFHLIMPLAYHTPLSLVFTRYWWSYSLEFVLVVAAAFALLATRGGLRTALTPRAAT